MSQRPQFPTAFVSLAKIMLALFLLLNTLSTRDIHREQAALAAMKQTFGSHTRAVAFDGNAPHRPVENKPSAGLSDMRNVLLLNRLRFTEDPTSLTITLLRHDVFAEGGSNVRPSLLPIMTSIADTIKSQGLELQITAHTALPEVPANDPVESWRDTVRDASTLYRLFLGAGIGSRDLSASGVGGSEPLAANDTPEHRAENRRIVLTVRAHEL